MNESGGVDDRFGRILNEISGDVSVNVVVHFYTFVDWVFLVNNFHFPDRVEDKF